jgi:hypothetical protein
MRSKSGRVSAIRGAARMQSKNLYCPFRRTTRSYLRERDAYLLMCTWTRAIGPRLGGREGAQERLPPEIASSRSIILRAPVNNAIESTCWYSVVWMDRSSSEVHALQFSRSRRTNDAQGIAICRPRDQVGLVADAMRREVSSTKPHERCIKIYTCAPSH